MKLEKLIIKNFRGYKYEEVKFDDFTTFVGINDVGKSTIFEALDVFFGNTSMEKTDRNIETNDDVELIGYFKELPEHIKLETVLTSFQDEYLTLRDNEDLLVLKQVYTGETLKLSEFLISSFPDSQEVENIHTMKIEQLRKKFADLITDVDKRKSAEIRKSVLKHYENGNLVKKEIKLNKSGGMKDISDKIHANLPIYQLFKSDRNNTDSDSEIQDPVKAIINNALRSSSVQEKLDSVAREIDSQVSIMTHNTLEMMNQMDETLAKDLSPNFKIPNWSSVFKLSLDTDSGIPLNNRGSGIRRLILLNFFKAQAEMENNRVNEERKNNIIYAFEEPETSQHPKYQQMLINSFKDMSESENTQIFMTTHSPSIANVVPINGLRLVHKKSQGVEILSREEALDEVVEQLGLISNIKVYDDQFKRLILVEGNSDAEFFEYVYSKLSSRSESEQKKNLFIPGGGSAIVDVLNKRFVQKLSFKKKFMIVDGDKSGNDYINKVDNSDVNIKQLKKATVEFYLPYDFIKKSLSSNNETLKVTKEEWNSGKEEYELTKKQKRILSSNNFYSSFHIEDCEDDVLKELQEIVDFIDID